MRCDLTGKRILLLGSSGKLGAAIDAVLPESSTIIRHNSRSFDAGNLVQVRSLLAECQPDLVINCIAFLGIDPCEREPERALLLNTLYPRLLAQLSVTYNYTLVHFSSDAVFRDRSEGGYRESDPPLPINLYGLTKYGGDRFIQECARHYYLLRLPILFGPSRRSNQFVDKMLARIKGGEQTLQIADDIVVTPGYTVDIATELWRLITTSEPFGLYHLANSGTVSLHGLISRIAATLRLDVTIERCSHRDFPAIGTKNSRTPLTTEKLVPLRGWEAAVDDYCRMIAADW